MVGVLTDPLVGTAESRIDIGEPGQEAVALFGNRHAVMSHHLSKQRQIVGKPDSLHLIIFLVLRSMDSNGYCKPDNSENHRKVLTDGMQIDRVNGAASVDARLIEESLCHTHIY